jgi:hypothetical protein
MTIHIFKFVHGWPKFDQVSKKGPTPRTLQTLAFDEECRFDISAFKYKIKQALFYFAFESRSIIKTERDSLAAKNTVQHELNRPPHHAHKNSSKFRARMRELVFELGTQCVYTHVCTGYLSTSTLVLEY